MKTTRRRLLLPRPLGHSLLFAVALAIAASHGPLAAGKVLVASTILGSSSSIYEFDDNGTLLGTLDTTPGGAVLFSIATDGTRFVTGHAYNGFRDYDLDGVYRGQLAGLPTPTEGPFVELDSHGNIYVLDAGVPRRLNPDGSPSMTFPSASFEYGIDADAAGNVYIARQSLGAPLGIYKYSPSGVEIGFISGYHFDIAIDEVGQMLYSATDAIEAYDISGPTPTFVRSIPAPSTPAGISFDPVSGNLFVTSIFGGYARELTTDGVLVRQYNVPGTNPFDAIAIRVPEASTLSMLIAAIACYPMRRFATGTRFEEPAREEPPV